MERGSSSDGPLFAVPTGAIGYLFRSDCSCGKFYLGLSKRLDEDSVKNWRGAERSWLLHLQENRTHSSTKTIVEWLYTSETFCEKKKDLRSTAPRRESRTPAKMLRSEQIQLLENLGHTKDKLSEWTGTRQSLVRQIEPLVNLSERQISKTLTELLGNVPKLFLQDVRPELKSWFLPSNSEDFAKISQGSTVQFEWECPQGHSFLQSANIVRRSCNPCSVCTGQRLLPGFNDLLTVRPDLAKEFSRRNPFAASKIYFSSGLKVLWECAICFTEWKTSPRNRVKTGVPCPNCFPGSFLEGIVYNYLKSVTSEEILRNTYPIRDATQRYQIDLYLPKLRLGFEVQDSTTHSQDSDQEPFAKSWVVLTKGLCGNFKKGPSYHESKRDLAKTQLGVRLIDLWEDEIRDGSFRSSIDAALKD